MQNEEEIFPFDNDDDAIEKNSSIFDDDFLNETFSDDENQEDREDVEGLDFNH